MKKWKLIVRFGLTDKILSESSSRSIAELNAIDLERCGLCPERDHAPAIWTHATDYGWPSERLAWDAKKTFDV